MHEPIKNRLIEFLEASGVRYDRIRHAPCRTSLESAASRASAGFPEAVGAKALVVKLNAQDGTSQFANLVIPGPTKLSASSLKTALPWVKKFRFSTPDELKALCGLEPGSIPPFAAGVFPKLVNLYVDDRIAHYPTLGFNAASFDESIIMKSEDYMQIAGISSMIDMAESP